MDMNALQAIIKLAQQRNAQTAAGDDSQAMGFQAPQAQSLPFQQKGNSGALDSILGMAGQPSTKEIGDNLVSQITGKPVAPQDQIATQPQTQDSALQSVLNMISGKDTNRNSALSRMASLFM